MDDFLAGPKNFDLWFSSADKSATLNFDGSYSFTLKKPLEFANEWEICVKQIIIKSPFNSDFYNIFYSDPDNPDQKSSVLKSLDMKNLGIPHSTKDLINTINNNIPNNMKSMLSFTIQDDGYVTANIKDTQLKFQNSYLTNALGFSANKNYPSQYPTQNAQIKASKKLQLLSPIFFLRTDITLPGSEVLIIDVFADSNKYINYKHEKSSYYNILRNYMSSITVSIKDLNDETFTFDTPFIIKFNLRRSSVL